ncbi:hypothetical protein CCY99_05555 [Helicobacter sp. 16-1353]|uniref:sulfite exporter TauE/SafE family protein n=1 Tax=Helicobacter sp. 16-1353 TaxID=2004996 RepID=UPI000DCAE3EC|nr:sulfite exporter TauE/SafE family protein [Helicobacter sp. 16-1353]RAX53847.1 hypothetical protein CCY99_05555 [Helicobacter sp. 16-1353]
MNNIDLISLFFIALTASFGHCLGMCGGIVLAYSQMKLQGNIFIRFISHFIYGFGRITTYAIIGMISAFIGSGFFLNQSTKGGFFIIIGFIMVLFGIFLLFSPKILALLEVNVANLRIFKKFFAFVLKKKSLFSFYILGILNGAIPCGIVYFFAISASVSGGILNGALVMIVFGVATLFPMVLLGIFNSMLNLTKYRNIINKLSFILIMFFGIYTIIKGFKILFT